jgi:hypothetical protein
MLVRLMDIKAHEVCKRSIFLLFNKFLISVETWYVRSNRKSS